jgi:phosphate transport system protein
VNNHTLKSYDIQLGQLTQSILQMGTLVRTMVLNSGKALIHKDASLVETAVTTDRKINELYATVENQATILLALQNPMAVDLRFVTSALKIADSLEQAGDLAKNITKRSQKMGAYSARRIEKPINEMVESVVRMLDDALSAIETRDPKKAMQVWMQDDEVDEQYHQLLNQIQQEIQSDPSNVEACTHVVFSIKNFERIGDYATSMAKTVYYVTSGQPASKDALRAAMAAMQQ